jgi:hypothetical protein
MGQQFDAQGWAPELFDQFQGQPEPIDEFSQQPPMHALEPEPEIDEIPQNPFYKNLASSINKGQLSLLAQDLLQAIDDDISSRSEWESSINRIMQFLGFKIEEYRDVPFARACAAFDSTLSTALLRFYAIARAELYPTKGPVKTEIIGAQTEERFMQAKAVAEFMNHYLTKIDEGYYPDSERLLMYVGLFGCCFRKIYYDPILKATIARHVAPQDLIINNSATSILESDRITHRIQLSKKEIKLRQQAGIYLKEVDLPDINDNEESESKVNKTIERIEGIDTSRQDNKSLFTFYEIYTDLILDDFDQEYHHDEIPLPYIVTICATSKQVFSVVRNWKEGDQRFVRKKHFVKYAFLPNYGIYNLGMAHTMGSNAIVLTSVLRQLVDAGTVKNFPGGIRQANMKIEQYDKPIGPNEFRPVETGGLPLQECLMVMPYSEPSQVLQSLRQELKEDTNNLGIATEMPVSDNRADAPVGTTLALLEVSSRLQSAVLRSLHFSQGQEFQMLSEAFAEHMPNDPYTFDLPGKEAFIVKSFFNKNIGIIPVSDPNVTTSTQRILKTDAIRNIALSAAQIHDLREVYKELYQAMGVPPEVIEKILPAPQSVPALDPVTENGLIMQGKPVKAYPFQNHKAHIMTHMTTQQNPLGMAHIQEHQAMDYINDMQQRMGIVMPPIEQIMQNPELANEISIKAAEATQQLLAEQQQQNPPPLDPNMVMMEDINQHREAASLKHEEAKLRAETEAYKTQTNFEAEKMKLETQKQLADDKNQKDLAIAEMKINEQKEKGLWDRFKSLRNKQFGGNQ